MSGYCSYCGRYYEGYGDFCSKACQRKYAEKQYAEEQAKHNRELAEEQARHNQELAEEQARRNAENARRIEQSNAETVEAYREMMIMQHEMEAKRIVAEELKKTQMREAEIEKTNCSLFGTKKNGFRHRLAENGFYEFKLGGCAVSDFAGGSETCKDSKATCKLTVGSLINKTPKGAGCLFFGLIFLPKGTKTPFKIATAEKTGLDFWGYTDISIPYIAHFLRLKRIYESECFTLKANEDIEEDRDFKLHRTDTSLPPGEYDIYVVLHEEIENGNKPRVAWCNAGSHITQDEHLQEIESKSGKIAKIDDITQFGSPACKIEKNGIRANGQQQIDITLDRKFSLKGKNAPAELWMRLYLTDVESGSEYKSKATKNFTLGADGIYAPYIDTDEKLKIPFTFDDDIPEGVYDAKIKLYELKAANGKGSNVGEATATYFSKKNYGYDIVVLNGEDISNEFKGLRKIGNNGKENNIEIENASYSLEGNKATVKIGKLRNAGSEPTGSLRIRLEFILPDDKIHIGGKFYKNHLEGGLYYSNINETIDCSIPAEYNDDTSLRISVYELSGNKKWVRLNHYDFLSVNKAKEERKNKARQAELRAENEKKEEKRRKNSEFDGKVHLLPFIILFSVPLWFGFFTGFSMFLIIDLLWCGFCVFKLCTSRRPLIFRFLPDKIDIIADALIPYTAILAIARMFDALICYFIIVAVMVMVAFLLKFLLKIRTKIIMILGYALCAAAFIVPLVLSFVS